MTQFWGAVTLVLTGVILADILTHPAGVMQAGNSLNQNLQTTFGAMLGH